MGTAGNRTQYSMLFAWRVPTPQIQRLLCLGVISGDHIVGANKMVSVRELSPRSVQPDANAERELGNYSLYSSPRVRLVSLPL